MKHLVTIASACSLLIVLFATSVVAQPVRNGMDVVWARDVAGATMTLDGELTEAAWAQAETIDLVWNGDHAFPGSGQRTEDAPTLADPSDGNNGTVYLLRDGNTLWLGAMVQDKSVGGRTGFFLSDGLIMNLLDRQRLVAERDSALARGDNNWFQGNRTEFFYNWRISADTSDATTTYDDGSLVGSGQPRPTASPRFHGFYNGYPAGDERDPRDAEAVAVWDAVTVVDGISNDDTHGDDVGYTMEMRIDLAALGYDFTQAGGDKMAFNVALMDADYYWPTNFDIAYRSRVWWQNQWGNNFNEGVGYLHGEPGVTVSSGAAPEVTEPEFVIGNGELYDPPTIDGALDEAVWNAIDPAFYVQYQGERSLLDMNPEVAKYYVFYFRPDIAGNGNAALVVDPSVARVKMFFRGDMLYVGVDVDDQAISGQLAEGGRDGMRFFFRDRDSLTTQGTQFTRRFGTAIDSSGVLNYEYDALDYQTERPGAIIGAVGLKGSSTVADPSDVDEGYQIELAIDLVDALAYPADLGDHMIWTAMNFFDGDYLESPDDTYGTRTWIVNERGNNGASIYGFMDENVLLGVATDPVSELPGTIELRGNYPNPFNPSTTLRYAIPQSGEVTLQVFDVLGRQVRSLTLGAMSAGAHEYTFRPADLASGLYLYRIQLRDVGSDNGRFSEVGRMILLK